MVEGPEGHECSTAAGGAAAAAANVAPMMMTPTEGTARVRQPRRPSEKAERDHGAKCRLARARPRGGVRPHGDARGERGQGASEKGGPARKHEAKYLIISFKSFPGFSEPNWADLGQNGQVSLETGLGLKVLRQSAAGLGGRNRFATG